MKNKLKTLKLSKVFIVLAFLLGLIIRTIQYFGEPSMWKDELFSVINIERMSLAELISQQPAYNQVAGVGYYILQKLVYIISGETSTEMVFRFYPFVASIISMWLFYLIAKRFLSGTKLVLSIFFIATALGPFAQSFQAKPYSGDIMFSMFFIWLLLVISERDLKTYEYWLFALVGFIASIVSLPAAIFVFVVIIILILRETKIAFLKNNLLLFIPWLLGSLWNIYYVLFVVTNETSMAMAEHHADSFPPKDGILNFLSFYPLSIVQNISEFVTIGVNPFNPIFLTRSVIMLLLSAIVIFMIFKQKRFDAALLWLPFIMCIGFVTFYLYPMAGRTAYYAFWPFLILPLIGLKYLQDNVSWFKRWLANVIAVILVLPSILIILGGLNTLPFTIEPVKKSLALYNENKHQGDVLYVHGSGDLYMKYYGPKMGVDEYILGKHYADVSKETYQQDLEQLKNKGRVWFYFTGYRPESNPELSRADIQELFEKDAKLLEEYPMGGSYPNYLYLFDFSK